MPASIELKNVSVVTATGRALFEDLNLRIDREHVEPRARASHPRPAAQSPE